jgi:tRNA(fMet)-specific endonuclease VapC
VSELFLLDTNIVSDLVKNPKGRVAKRIAEVGEENVATSVIVAAELRYGAAKKRSRRLSEQLEAILGVLVVLPLDRPVDAAYGEARARLEKEGRSIGANDLFIAAHAQSLGRTIVTDNEDEFARVPKLAVANWLRDDRGG